MNITLLPKTCVCTLYINIVLKNTTYYECIHQIPELETIFCVTRQDSVNLNLDGPVVRGRFPPNTSPHLQS